MHPINIRFNTICTKMAPSLRGKIKQTSFKGQICVGFESKTRLLLLSLNKNDKRSKLLLAVGAPVGLRPGALVCPGAGDGVNVPVIYP